MSVLSINDEHKARLIDSEEKNKFKFAWLSNIVKVKFQDEEFDVTLGSCIQKINLSGRAKCTLCADEIEYGNRGVTAITKHVRTKKHAEKESAKRRNFSLPVPFFNENTLNKVDAANVNVPLCDRVSNLEGMLLGVLAENNLPFTVAPVLIDLSKAMASDKKALSQITMARTTASYKMKFGLAKTYFEETLANLRTCAFSLNVDEATSSNRMRVLCILASYFSLEHEKVVIDHVASINVTRVTAEQLYTEISLIFEKNNIPFQNLVSILMDSCNVMRGSKSGLETRIRQEKAPHLLDIDGDSCHHIHNACKLFCKPFDGFVENYLKDVFTDFNWSADLCEKLKEICVILNTKYTSIENMVKHRWLSIYDITLSNLQMFDCLTIFYYGFLNKTDRLLYFNLCISIYKQREVGTEGKEQLREIWDYLQKKLLTADGKKRKERIISKLFHSRKKLQIIMHFFTSALPLLKRYVCLFQMKEPLIHKLFEEQRELYKEFLSLFVKPEYLLHKPMIEILGLEFKEDSILPPAQMYLGSTTSSIISKQLSDPNVKEFLKNSKAAFISCAKYLQKTLPLKSNVLKCLSAIDPIARGHHLTLARFKRLPQLMNTILTDDEKILYELEVHKYQTDNLPAPVNDGPVRNPVRVDMWWAQVFKTGKYPALSKIVKAILSIFHGPQVESAFSSMSSILDDECGRMNVQTLSAIQTVKYKLRKSEKSAVEYFKREDYLHAPVPKNLCTNLRNSYKAYKNELDSNKREREAKREKFKILQSKLISKKKAIDSVKAAEKKLRLARKRKLEQMVKKIEKKKKQH